MSETQIIEFTDNQAIADRKDNYLAITVDATKVIQSVRQSLRAFEWLHPDGRFKTPAELNEPEQEAYQQARANIESGKALPKPVLGIGLLENIEIGMGRAVFMLAAASGAKTIPVHIPKAHEADFKPFIAA